MGTTKCRIPLGLFYGHTTLLPNDIPGGLAHGPTPPEVAILTPVNVQTHLSVLSYLLEDIGCRYQLACAKLRRLLEPLLKPEISSIDHISYYLPKGKERNKLGLNNCTDQTILAAYQVNTFTMHICACIYAHVNDSTCGFFNNYYSINQSQTDSSQY